MKAIFFLPIYKRKNNRNATPPDQRIDDEFDDESNSKSDYLLKTLIQLNCKHWPKSSF